MIMYKGLRLARLGTFILEVALRATPVAGSSASRLTRIIGRSRTTTIGSSEIPHSVSQNNPSLTSSVALPLPDTTSAASSTDECLVEPSLITPSSGGDEIKSAQNRSIFSYCRPQDLLIAQCADISF